VLCIVSRAIRRKPTSEQDPIVAAGRTRFGLPLETYGSWTRSGRFCAACATAALDQSRLCDSNVSSTKKKKTSSEASYSRTRVRFLRTSASRAKRLISPQPALRNGRAARVRPKSREGTQLIAHRRGSGMIWPGRIQSCAYPAPFRGQSLYHRDHFQQLAGERRISETGWRSELDLNFRDPFPASFRANQQIRDQAILSNLGQVRFVTSSYRPFRNGKGTPAERLEALRSAYEKAFADDPHPVLNKKCGY
jgi:hypothetical protein